MNLSKNQKEKESLERRYSTQNDIHAKKFSQLVTESRYMDSCASLNETYTKLQEVSLLLGTPVPIII